MGWPKFWGDFLHKLIWSPCLPSLSYKNANKHRLISAVISRSPGKIKDQLFSPDRYRLHCSTDQSYDRELQSQR
jgi:hypothetical protein